MRHLLAVHGHTVPADAPSDIVIVATAVAIDYDLRDETIEDEPFLVDLYRSLRTDAAFIGAPVDQQRAYITFQRDLQRQTIEAVCPTAESSIILVDGQPAGELIIERTPEFIRLIEIAVVPPLQHQGIGSDVIAQLCAEAAEMRIPILLRVAVDNTAARAFYERRGFVEIDADRDYLDLAWGSPVN